jgi:hypothetical protein
LDVRIENPRIGHHRASGHFENYDFADFAETAGYGLASTLALAGRLK